MASKTGNQNEKSAQKTWTRPELKRLGTIADVAAPKNAALIQGNFT